MKSKKKFRSFKTEKQILYQKYSNITYFYINILMNMVYTLYTE